MTRRHQDTTEAEQTDLLFDEELERLTLALMFHHGCDNPASVIGIPSEIFTTPLHRAIAGAISYLADHGMLGSYFDIHEELFRRRVRCSIAYLTGLSDGVVAEANLERRVAWLADLHRRRQLGELSESLSNRLLDLSEPLEKIVEDVRAAL